MMLAWILEEVTEDKTVQYIWYGVGFLGQGIFGGRMLLQWLATEKARESVIPISFWYMSLVGALITLSYAIYQTDPVFITAQAGGLIVYIRNLYFIRLNRRQDLIT
jgi:lipid-A-disaccharide synthase-like uncharacterized protein